MGPPWSSGRAWTEICQSQKSKGCHDLIKQGAKLVDCAQDILEELKDLPNLAHLPELFAAQTVQHARSSNAQSPSPSCAIEDTPEEVHQHASIQVLAHMGQNPVGLDELMLRCGMSASQLQVELFQLELKGALGRLPGGLFQQLFRPQKKLVKPLTMGLKAA
jgi:DNA processing protein